MKALFYVFVRLPIVSFKAFKISERSHSKVKVDKLVVSEEPNCEKLGVAAGIAMFWDAIFKTHIQNDYASHIFTSLTKNLSCFEQFKSHVRIFPGTKTEGNDENEGMYLKDFHNGLKI